MILFSEINLEMITLDQLVPPNHLVRKMGRLPLTSLIYDLGEDMYSEVRAAQVLIQLF